MHLIAFTGFLGPSLRPIAAGTRNVPACALQVPVGMRALSQTDALGCTRFKKTISMWWISSTIDLRTQSRTQASLASPMATWIL